MKRNLLYLLLLTLVSFSFISCDDDDYLREDQMTENIKLFVKQVFPNSEFKSIQLLKEEETQDQYYKIKLTNDIEMDMKYTAVWSRIESPNISYSVLSKILKHSKPFVIEDIEPLKNVKPNLHVTKLLQKQGQEMFIYLANGTVYVLHRESDKTTLYTALSATSQLPATVTGFVTNYFGAEYTYTQAWQSVVEEEYRITLTGNIAICFDANDNWTRVDGKVNALPESFRAVLPQSLQKYIVDNYSELELTAIEKDGEIYTLSFSDATTVVFDSETGLPVSKE